MRSAFCCRVIAAGSYHRPGTGKTQFLKDMTDMVSLWYLSGMETQNRKPRATTRQAALESLTAGIPENLGVEEFARMLEEQVEEWSRPLLEEGAQKGEARLLLRQLEEKFGAV